MGLRLLMGMTCHSETGFINTKSGPDALGGAARIYDTLNNTVLRS